MPKREKAKNLQKEQPTHTPHPHHEKAPRSFHECSRCFAKTTIAHSKFLMCIDAKFPPTQQSTPKFHNAPKSEVSDYLKRPSKFPPTQQSTPKFPYTHEVREFLTIQHPYTPDHTHTTPPKPFGVSDCLQNPPPFKGKFHTLGGSTNHHPRHRERAVIRLCACRKMPNTLADANLP